MTGQQEPDIEATFAAPTGSASQAWNNAVKACLLIVESDSYCVPNPPTIKQYRE